MTQQNKFVADKEDIRTLTKFTAKEAKEMALYGEEKLPDKFEVEVEVENVPDPMEEDFEIARKNMKKLADKGTSTIDNLISLAKESEHPRVYEVLANMISTLTNANKDLVDLHMKKAKVKPPSPEVNNQTNVQNNTKIFVGNPSELLDMLDQADPETSESAATPTEPPSDLDDSA